MLVIQKAMDIWCHDPVVTTPILKVCQIIIQQQNIPNLILYLVDLRATAFLSLESPINLELL